MKDEEIVKEEGEIHIQGRGDTPGNTPAVACHIRKPHSVTHEEVAVGACMGLHIEDHSTGGTPADPDSTIHSPDDEEEEEGEVAGHGLDTRSWPGYVVWSGKTGHAQNKVAAADTCRCAHNHSQLSGRTRHGSARALPQTEDKNQPVEQEAAENHALLQPMTPRLQPWIP